MEENKNVSVDEKVDNVNEDINKNDDNEKELKARQERLKQQISKMPSLEDVKKIKAKLQAKDINKAITLQDCINIVDGFIDGSVGAEQLELFGTKMTIRAYIPILEKMSILMKVLMKHEISAVESTEIKMTELYKDIFFTVVLGLYGQIQFDEFKDKELLTYENYDKLFPIFYQYILAYCKTDYEVFMGMLKDCISLNGVQNMVDAVEMMDSDKLQEAVNSNKELIESLKDNEKLVEDMKDMLMMNDETTANVVKQIKGMTVSDVIEKSKIKMEEDKNKIIGVDFSGSKDEDNKDN